MFDREFDGDTQPRTANSSSSPVRGVHFPRIGLFDMIVREPQCTGGIALHEVVIHYCCPILLQPASVLNWRKTTKLGCWDCKRKCCRWRRSGSSRLVASFRRRRRLVVTVSIGRVIAVGRWRWRGAGWWIAWTTQRQYTFSNIPLFLNKSWTTQRQYTFSNIPLFLNKFSPFYVFRKYTSQPWTKQTQRRNIA